MKEEIPLMNQVSALVPWVYDKAMYKRLNEIERLLKRLKGLRRVFSRFDKLDRMYPAFVRFALIVEAFRLG
jgi:transposase